jgi:sterol desaturase/sphingolipid hydroxylase (fatty acid hydroxylase superfamily)
VKLLQSLYDATLAFLTLHSVASWPGWLKAATAIGLSDFLAWFHHWVRHKVPLFWRLHAVHHSQPELNLFTDVRYHPLEYLVSQTILFLPIFMFQAAFPVALGYSFFHQWYTKFYHCNLRTNLGPLRYLLVTPQSHRVHHSVRVEHRDANFGVIFSIWDRLFGTQHADAAVYPETGIDDPSFPRDRGISGWSLLRDPWRQFLYPLRRRATA